MASMVVFEDGAAEALRLPPLRHPPRAAGQDDFRSLAEAVTRRFERIAASTRTATTAASRRCPNLLVIDGGKGQLGAALDAMAAFDLPRVAVVSLAKREEEVYLPGRAGAGGAAARVAGAAAAAAGARRGPPLRAARAPHAQGRGPDGVAARHAARRRRRARAGADRALRRRGARCSRPRARSSRPCPACRRPWGGRSTTTCTGSAATARRAPRRPSLLRLTQVTYGVGPGAPVSSSCGRRRAVHHELPWPARAPSACATRSRTGAGARRTGCALPRRRRDHVRSTRPRVSRRPARSSAYRASRGAIAHALAASWGERVSYGELAARAGRPARRARRARSARAARSTAPAGPPRRPLRRLARRVRRRTACASSSGCSHLEGLQVSPRASCASSAWAAAPGSRRCCAGSSRRARRSRRSSR